MNRKVFNYILFLGGVLYLFIFIKYKYRIPCIFHEITGLYCPGCGITRALASIIQLNFYQAFRYNNLIILIIPIGIIYILNNKKIPNYAWYICLAIAILFGILRNISIFEFLAPTII